MRPREAVEPGEADDEIELAIVELQLVDVGDHRLDLVLYAAFAGGLHRPVEHRLRDVSGDVADTLIGAQAAECDPTSARDVQHRSARRHLADLVGGGMQLAQIGAEPLLSSPEQFAEYMRTEHRRWAQVIREAKITLD